MAQDKWIGRTIGGRYEIRSLLGKGGMSAVYKAYDPNLRREVAIKLIHSHLSDDPEFVRRFEEEAAAVARLRHPNIIQVHDFDHDDEVYYIVFEYIAGESLQDRLKRLSATDERIPLADSLQIVISTGDALSYAHEAGLVHRDIKPANIMINKREEAILMDFGIAKISGASQHTATGMVMGTARYMSPEQVMGEKIDLRTDIYALGVTLFEMVNGSPPFESDSVAALMMKHVNEEVPDLHVLRPDTPPSLVAVIDKALAKERDERYQTSADFVADLRYVENERAAGAATAEAVMIAGGTEQTAPVMSGEVVSTAATGAGETVVEPGGVEAGVTEESPAADTQLSKKRRPLMIGGAIVAFIFIAACIGFSILVVQEMSADATVTSGVEDPAVEQLQVSGGVEAVDAAGGEQGAEESAADGAEVIAVVEEVAVEAEDAAEVVETAVSAYPDGHDPLFLTSFTYDGLIVALALPEADTERVLFSIDDPVPSIDNGRSTAGSMTVANNSIGPIPHEFGDHTLYVQFIDADGNGGEIASFDYTIDDIVLNYTQLPYDFDTDGIPALFTMFVVDGDTDALYRYGYGVDSQALDQYVDGVAEAGVIQLDNLEVGDHVLYVQATSDYEQTAVVAFPFTIE